MEELKESYLWTIDSHTAGEGTRLVIRGLPGLHGNSLSEKMADAQARFPRLPSALLQEPRGHKDLYGAVLTEPSSPGADFGVVFMNNQDYEPMCGHGLIGVVTSLLEAGLLQAVEPVTSLLADTPAGLIPIQASVRSGKVQEVAFDNVPSFALILDRELRLEDGLCLMVEVAFGGNFFLLIRDNRVGMALEMENVAALAKLGMQILKAANEQIPVIHPTMPYLNKITDLRYYGISDHPEVDSRNIVILGDHMVDRSPCGTGTCAELAVRYARGETLLGQPFVSESLLGTRFRATALREIEIGSGTLEYPAITPRLEGRAFVMGMSRWEFDKNDPFRDGFLMVS